jgi:hypothetical protein
MLCHLEDTSERSRRVRDQSRLIEHSLNQSASFKHLYICTFDLALPICNAASGDGASFFKSLN